MATVAPDSRDNSENEYWVVMIDTLAPWPTVVFVGSRERALEFQRESVSDYESVVQPVEGPVALEREKATS